MKKLIFILSILSIFISCNRANNNVGLNSDNYLIFGHFYGECFGENCVETFKLTGKYLYEDTLDDYSHKNFKFVKLNNDKFEKVKDLIDFFPNQLLNVGKTVFGCPDCADGGGLFIRYSNNGHVKSWIIDQRKDKVPNYLYRFISEVNEKIKLINN